MAINDFNTEQWAPCPIEGYEHYQVSDQGRVLNTKTGRILKSTARHSYEDYRAYNLSSGGRTKKISAHRLVWMAFNGEIPLTLEVDHLDDNPTNNRLDNLQLLSHSDNNRKRRGGWKWGEGKRRNRPKAKWQVSEETREKCRAAVKSYNEAKKKALKKK